MRALPLLILMFVATDALAQYGSGLNLFWNRCHAGGGTASASFACDSSTGPSLDLIASIVIPADIPEFAGAMVTMDIWVSGAALPPGGRRTRASAATAPSPHGSTPRRSRKPDVRASG